MTFKRVISQSRLDTLMTREAQIYESRTPNCRKAFEQAGTVLLNGVPMPWMGDWGTTYPLFMSHAKDNRITDIDGNDYIDFCLGDHRGHVWPQPGGHCQGCDKPGAAGHHHHAAHRGCRMGGTGA